MGDKNNVSNKYPKKDKNAKKDGKEKKQSKNSSENSYIKNEYKKWKNGKGYLSPAEIDPVKYGEVDLSKCIYS
jgi:hypothetical protein